jgi:hypothetical protein
MVKAIHRQGQGLETLQYHDSAGRSVALFLTEPEIVHLSDVARLLDSLMPAGWCAVAVWLLLTAWLAWRKIALPAISHLLSSLLLLITGMLVIVLLLGPVKVFYQLHEWIFPPGHQWFFYYEDSLMTTLLKAPDLFAPISLLLLVTCILFFTIMLVFVRKLLVEKNLSQAQYSYGKKTKRVVKKIRKR